MIELYPLKQATAGQKRTIGQFVDVSDFVTPMNALTIANTDVRLKKGDAAFANKNSGGGTALEEGDYEFTFDDVDSATVGELTGYVKKAGAVTIHFKAWVLSPLVYEAWHQPTSAPFDASQHVTVGGMDGTFQAALAVAMRQEMDANSTNLDAIQTLIAANATAIAALNDVSVAEITAEINDFFNVTTRALPGKVTLPAAATLIEMWAHQYKVLRNPKTQTNGVGGKFTVFNSAGTVAEQEAAASSTATEASKGLLDAAP